MCLILLAWRAHPDFPLVFAGNRDEAYERPSAAAGFWRDDPLVFGGRDLEQGGTWLGLTRGGRFAAVTNYRDGRAANPAAPRSRGELTAGFLRGSDEPRSYLENIAQRGADYGGHTLILGDSRNWYVYSNRDPAIRELSAGVHGLSNHLLDTPWPKVSRGKERLSGLLTKGEKKLVDGLFRALADRTVAPDVELPDSGIGLLRERELSPAFIAGERYGTRASTVMLVNSRDEVMFVERRFGAHGAPLGETAQRLMLQPRATLPPGKAAGQTV
jgi:uncharacterized protein with NRDE domain